MKKEMRTQEQVDRDIRTAGSGFLAFKLSDMLLRIGELENKTSKDALINDFYHNQEGYSDSDPSGTRWRVNAARRIISAGQTIYALEKVANSNASSEAVERAKETLHRIEIGELQLPSLE